jgi:hypothetical protein
MKISRLAIYALAVTVGAALLGGCSTNGGSSLAPPAQPQGAARFGLSGLFSPDNKKTTEPYFYVSDVLDDAVYEFDSNHDWVGSITGISYPAGECSRYGKHTFWVTASGSNEIEEFKVGGTSPVETLSESAGEPWSCAIDPATGDLATTITSNGDVILYQNASGSGTVITTPLFAASYDGYDNLGNLFVDGFTSGPTFALIELPKGSSTFLTITTSNTVQWPGGVQWDGKYVTVGDENAHAIYRYTVSGTTATLVDTVKLRGAEASFCAQDVITTHFVYCPDPGMMEANVYKYPRGGHRVAYLRRSFNSPVGAVKVTK